MKRILLAIAILAGLAPPAGAHVGSPNVFLEGRAGMYSVYAIVRPPAALPGVAQASVRVQEPGVRAVTLLPVMWQAGSQGSPSPVNAQLVPGETNLWSAEVWLLRPGSYTLRISVEGAQGAGETTMPVNVLGRENQPMQGGLQFTLVSFGVLLFLGAVLIVGAVAREGCVDPGFAPAPADRTRGRRVAALTALVLSAGAAAGAARWRNMDLAYRTQGIQKPEPVAASVRTETNRVVLELSQAGQTPTLPSWATLVPDHGKLMHLFLLREPLLDVFAHLHPVRRDERSFALDVPALPAGGYQLYGDVTFENGLSQTLIAQVTLPPPAGAPLDLPPLATNLNGEVICGFPTGLPAAPGEIVRDMDDSWHVARVPARSVANAKHPGGGLVSPLMGGHTLLFDNADAVIAGRETSLRFAAFAPDGSPAALQPYMGMFGHAAVRRGDGSVFAHLHPSGSFSMAAQEVFRQRESGSDMAGPRGTWTAPSNSVAPDRVSFPYEFPKSGPYRLWIQVRIGGRVLTGVFDLEIKRGA